MDSIWAVRLSCTSDWTRSQSAGVDERVVGDQLLQHGEMGLRRRTSVARDDLRVAAKRLPGVGQAPLQRTDPQRDLLLSLLLPEDVEAHLLQFAADSLELGGGPLQRFEFHLQGGDAIDHAPEVDLAEVPVFTQPGQRIPPSRGLETA